MPLLFVAVPETPEDDYVVQVQLDPDEAAVAFGFAWRTEEGLRVLSNPDVFDETAYIPQLDALCTRMTYRECQLDTREEVLAVARDIVAPAYIRTGETPDDWVDFRLLD